MKHLISVHLVVLWGLATAGVAAAADFTFTVPVDVQNMAAEINEGRVTCQIFAKESPAGEGQQFFSLDSVGSFQDTVTVVVNVDAPADPREVHSYTCVLSLRLSQGHFEDVGTGDFQSDFPVVHMWRG